MVCFFIIQYSAFFRFFVGGAWGALLVRTIRSNSLGSPLGVSFSKHRRGKKIMLWSRRKSLSLSLSLSLFRVKLSRPLSTNRVKTLSHGTGPFLAGFCFLRARCFAFAVDSICFVFLV